MRLTLEKIFMRVRFLKEHLYHKKDTEEEIGDELANYLIRVKVAEEVEEESNSLKTLRELHEKEEFEPAKEKAESTGLPTAKKKKK